MKRTHTLTRTTTYTLVRMTAKQALSHWEQFLGFLEEQGDDPSYDTIYLDSLPPNRKVYMIDREEEVSQLTAVREFAAIKEQS